MGTCGDEEEQGKEGKPARDESLWRKSSAAVRIHFTWRSNDRRSTHRAADRRSEWGRVRERRRNKRKEKPKGTSQHTCCACRVSAKLNQS